jgi:hypothetical protein
LEDVEMEVESQIEEEWELEQLTSVINKYYLINSFNDWYKEKIIDKFAKK